MQDPMIIMLPQGGYAMRLKRDRNGNGRIFINQCALAVYPADVVIEYGFKKYRGNDRKGYVIQGSWSQSTIDRIMSDLNDASRIYRDVICSMLVSRG